MSIGVSSIGIRPEAIGVGTIAVRVAISAIQKSGISLRLGLSLGFTLADVVGSIGVGGSSIGIRPEAIGVGTIAIRVAISACIQKSGISLRLGLSITLADVVGSIGVGVSSIGIRPEAIGVGTIAVVAISAIQKSRISLGLSLSISITLADVVGSIGVGVSSIGIRPEAIGVGT